MMVSKFKFLKRIATGVLIALLASPAFASGYSKGGDINDNDSRSGSMLGEASGYNLFIKKDILNYGDIDGKVAGGDDVSLRNGAIGIKTSRGDGGATVYADDDLSLYNVDVYNRIAYGDKLNSKYSWYETDRNPDEIDFDAAFDYLNDLSSDLKGKTSTGIFNIQNGTLSYTGSAENNIHIINLSQDEFDAIGKFTWNIADNESVIVNVEGKDIINSGSVSSPDNVMFNFFEAKNMKFTDSFEGNILAPKARIQLLCATITGQVIAKYWDGDGSLKQDTLFDPSTGNSNDETTNPSVPIPIPAGLLLIGIGMMFFRKK